MTSKIPATVVTGFLGAGKTTVIRNLLSQAEGRRIALIINEFGDVGVDGDILRGCCEVLCREDDIIELANGCICCTVADEFIPTMTKLLERDDPPHHIIIETSGLALPQPLVRAFTWPEIRARVTVDGVITVVDSAALAEGRFASDEAAVQAQREADPELDHESPLEELFEDQLACADMILLNKADLLAAEQLDRIERDLTGEVRPGVRFLRARDGKVDLAVLLGLGAGAETDLEVRKSHHEMLGEADHDHDDFTSFVVALPPIASQAELIDRLSRAILKQDILRVKGFAAIEGKAMRLVVQAAGPRIDSYFDRPWGAEEVRAGALVVIGESGLDAALVQEALTAALVT